MLRFQAAPPFSFEAFLERCQGLIPEHEIALLRRLPQVSLEGDGGTPAALQQWHSFECALRNELVKIRAQRKHVDAHPYLRPAVAADTAIMRLARQAAKSSSVVEAEKMLDQARWHHADERAFGHYFDREALFAYAFKLLIALRWQQINHAAAAPVIDDTIAHPPVSENMHEGN